MGSRLAVRLLKDGNEMVFLSRNKRGHSAKERVVHILQQIDPLISEAKIFVIDVNLTNRDLLKDSEILKFNDIDAIWHLAANLSFKEERRKEIFDDNINALKNILTLAKLLKCPVYYTSTAYIHGRIDKTIIHEGILEKPIIFNNPYEESKYVAEKTIFGWGQQNSNSFIIFRPSILVESDRKTLSFFGYYSVVGALYNLRVKALHFYQKYPTISKLFGLRLENDILRIFVPFPYSKTVFLNLMPVDTAIEWMTAIVEKKGSLGKIFNITNPEPFSMKEITKQTLSGLDLQLLTFNAPRFIVTAYFSFIGFLGLFNKNLKSLARTLKFYKFYMIHSNEYRVESTRNIVGGKRFDKRFHFEKDFLERLTRSFILKLKRH